MLNGHLTLSIAAQAFRKNLETFQDFIRDEAIAFLLCRLVLDSLSGRCSVVAMVVVCAFYALGIAFMICFLIGTQRSLNRERRAGAPDQKSFSRHWWR
jgi:uncharacterized MAPEG superfamily protein